MSTAELERSVQDATLVESRHWSSSGWKEKI